jgi:hypothetical protein
MVGLQYTTELIWVAIVGAKCCCTLEKMGDTTASCSLRSFAHL